MKKIFIILVLLVTVNSIKAQGNLQFNRVVNFSASQSNGGSYSTGAYVYQTFQIPAGKVWKIENVMVGNSNGSAMGFVKGCDACAATFNNIIAYNIYYASGYATDNAKFPIWLSDGNYSFIISDNNNSSQGDNLLASYSAIEFNITP
jgi:hypothetical protein